MRKLIVYCAAVPLLLTVWSSNPAGAGPAWKEDGKGGPPGHAKSKDKKIPPGQLKKLIRYKGGGPPPWAPAHGYRRNFGGGGASYAPPFGIAAGRCAREALGAALGGVAGGAAGSTVGKGDGRTAAIIAGSVIGVIVGGAIGRSMDQMDSACIGQILEHAPDARTTIWKNPGTGAEYRVIPQRSYQSGDQEYCREYTTTSLVGGREVERHGTACRQPDGSWRLIS